jgi:hypothetical protein
VFCTFLIVRGLTAVVFGTGAGKWFGTVLQMVTVVLMFEAFFFLPGVLGALGSRMTHGDTSALLFPPVWFAALHAWIMGDANQLLGAAAVRGLFAFTLVAVALVPIYLLPARWLGQRALEKRSRERAAATTFVVHAVSIITRAQPRVRAVFLFAVTSLVRSRRHHLVLATYIGMAIAVSAASIWMIDDRGSIKLDRPASWMLTLPMLFLFFGVQGLRSGFRVPTEVEANWPFRVAPPSLSTCVNATVLVMCTLAVLPTAAVTLLVIGPGWPILDTVLVIALQMLAGVMLIEVLLLGWRKVPFACAHAPSPDVLKAWWPVYGLALYLYAFKLADLQFAATTSLPSLIWYVLTCLSIIGVVRLLRSRDLRRRQLEFDLAATHAEQLNLSEATS